MKKLFLSAMLCCLGFAAFSQKLCLDVKNETNCTVYFRLVGDEICRCGETYSSCTYSLPPSGSMSFPSSVSICGFPGSTPKTINAAYAFNDPACLSSTIVQVGETTCGYLQVDNYLALNPAPDCRRCDEIKVEWISDGIPCNTTCATLRFYQ